MGSHSPLFSKEHPIVFFSQSIIADLRSASKKISNSNKYRWKNRVELCGLKILVPYVIFHVIIVIASLRRNRYANLDPFLIVVFGGKNLLLIPF